jgi:transcriptional regulator with GAF, ATPase, and Fis domain
MRRPLFHHRLTGVVFALILGTGFTIAVSGMAFYSRNLRDSGIRQGEYLASSMAAAFEDQPRPDDPQALNMLLKAHLSYHPAIAYMFITLNGQVLAQAFSESLPNGIQKANTIERRRSDRIKFIKSEGGETYLDFSVPVFRDRAGVLRVGMYERSLVPWTRAVWVPSVFSSGVVVILALLLAFVLIRRATQPLRQLTLAAEKVDQGNLAFDCSQCRHEEVHKLALSFSKMIERLKSCAQSLSDSGVQVDRLHHQIFHAFEIIRTVGAHATLQDLCTYLIEKLKEIMACRHLAMMTVSRSRDYYFLCSQGQLKTIPPEQFETVWGLLADIDRATFFKRSAISIPMLDGDFQSSHRIGIFPIQFEHQMLGALFVGCPKDCRCHSKGLKSICLILQECAGAIKRAIHHAEDLQRIECQISKQSQYCGIVGKDRRMQTVFKLIDDIAPTDAAVLIQGESGTGKELVSRAIHAQSPRKDMPFVVINCSAYPTSLLESELFGHEKGAFTGAVRKKIGRFEQADGGTVFLDEIGEIAPSAQIKLLRVLQTHAFERIGGEQTLQVQVRIIAATNKDLLEEVRKGRFREDLYYRLNVIPIHMPPLRHRPNDIPLLARHFLDRFSSEQGRKVKDFRTETMARLMEYEWPGNVRELENTVEHALVLTKGDYVEVAVLPPNIRSIAKITDSYLPGKAAVLENEKQLFLEVLEASGWNKKLAAQRLGISRSTLYNKIKKYRLAPPTIH